MQQFTDELSALLADCRQHEAILEKISLFAREGGHFRLAIVADHPDPEVAAAVATITENHMPRELMMKNILTHAEINVKRSRDKIIDFAAARAPLPASTIQAVQP